MEAFDNTVNKYLSFLDNEYVSAGLSIILVLYAGLAAPALPESIAKLFDNTLFKILMFFLIVYISKKDTKVALIAAIGVMISIQTLNKIKFNKEMMAVVNNDTLFKQVVKNCSCGLCSGEACDCKCHVEYTPVYQEGGNTGEEHSIPLPHNLEPIGADGIHISEFANPTHQETNTIFEEQRLFAEEGQRVTGESLRRMEEDPLFGRNDNRRMEENPLFAAEHFGQMGKMQEESSGIMASNQVIGEENNYIPEAETREFSVKKTEVSNEAVIRPQCGAPESLGELNNSSSYKNELDFEIQAFEQDSLYSLV
jgi:hypothetical protein